MKSRNPRTRSMNMPLHSRAAISNTKRQRDSFTILARVTIRQFVLSQKLVPFVRMRVAKQIPCLVRQLIRWYFLISNRFLQVLSLIVGGRDYTYFRPSINVVNSTLARIVGIFKWKGFHFFHLDLNTGDLLRSVNGLL